MAFPPSALFNRKEKHSNACALPHTRTHTSQIPSQPPTTKQIQTNNSTVWEHNMLPRIPPSRWAVWLSWRETRTVGCHPGEKRQRRHRYSVYTNMVLPSSHNSAIQFQATQYSAANAAVNQSKSVGRQSSDHKSCDRGFVSNHHPEPSYIPFD